MRPASSGEHCLFIDKFPEEIMFFYSPDSLQAETRYRQDRLRRDYQRPGWLRRKPQPPAQPQQPSAPELRARPAM